MRQTLFYIPETLFGLPLFGFGLLLAVWAILCAVAMIYFGRRHGLKEVLSMLPVVLLVAAVIVFVLPAVAEKGLGLPVRGYGVMMLLAVLASAGLGVYRAKQVGLTADVIYTLAFWMFIPGILGARLFHVIEYWDTYMVTYTLAQQQGGNGLLALIGDIANVTKGGLVVYGSLIGGMLGVVLFVRRHKIALLPLLDLIAPCLMVGLAIGRIGCLLNGCCYGGHCEHRWAIEFPALSPPYISQVERGEMRGFQISGGDHEEPIVLAVVPGSDADRAGLKKDDRIVKAHGQDIVVTGQLHEVLLASYHFVDPEQDEAGRHEHTLNHWHDPIDLVIEGRDEPIRLPGIQHPPDRSLPIHPTQIYSAINATLLCLLLLAFHPLRRRDGQTFALLITIYPIARFLLEAIRTDETSFLGTGLSVSQNFSVLLMLFAAGLWWYTLRQPVGTTRFEKVEKETA